MFFVLLPAFIRIQKNVTMNHDKSRNQNVAAGKSVIWNIRVGVGQINATADSAAETKKYWKLKVVLN